MTEVAYSFTILFMRTLNKQLLHSYITIKGNLGREILAVESKIPFVLIDRTLKGTRTATDVEMDAICRATGYTLDELFPLNAGKGEQSA